jgi:hypothetical protein
MIDIVLSKLKCGQIIFGGGCSVYGWSLSRSPDAECLDFDNDDLYECLRSRTDVVVPWLFDMLNKFDTNKHQTLQVDIHTANSPSICLPKWVHSGSIPSLQIH